MKFDMHCHVREGSMDSKVGIDEYITMLKKNGFGGMVITDHNTYKGYRYWRDHLKDNKHKDFVVLKGIEYDTMGAGHILVIMPAHVKLKILELRGLPLPALIDIVHRNGGILGPAHPCGEKYLSITNTKYYRTHPEVMRKFDFIETFNACESFAVNAKAERLAKIYNLPGFGGSDAHKEACVSTAYTEFPEDIRTESELINYVKSKSVVRCGGTLYRGTTKEKIGKVNNVLIYSFWVYNKVAGIVKVYQRRKKIKEEVLAYAR